MAYKFQVGPAQLSGALTQEGAGTFEGAVVGETTISASARLSGHDLIIQEGNNIGTSLDSDLMTLSNGQLAVAGDMSASADIKGMALDLEAGIDAGVGNFTVSAAGAVAAASTLSSSLVDFGVKAAGAGTIRADFVPDSDSAYALGTNSDRWRYVYADELVGDSVNVSELSGALEFNLDVHSTGGLEITDIYDNTVDSLIGIKNHTAFTDNRIMVWDAGSDQFENSLLQDDGSEIQQVSGDFKVMAGDVSASAAIAGLNLDLDAGIDAGAGNFTVSTAGAVTAASTLSASLVDFGVKAASAGTIRGNWVPDSDSAYALGTNSDRWRYMYADEMIGDKISVSELSGALEYNLDIQSDGGLAISAVYDNTADVTIAMKNVANFSDNAIQVWDESNNQFEDSIMTDDGSLIIVAGDLSASGQLDIDGASNLDGAATLGSTLDVAGIITASAGAEFRSTISVLGDANFEGNVYLGAGGNDVIYLDTGLEFSGSVIPETDSAFDLGSDAKRWSTIYVDNIVGADLALDVFTGTSYAAGTDVLLANGNATLRDIASNGQTIRVKNISGGLITVDCDGSDTFFDTGTTQIELETDGAAVTLISSGSSWYII